MTEPALAPESRPEPALIQDAEGISPRAIWAIAAGVTAVTALLVAIAWLLVVPPAPPRAAAAHTPLEHGLVDQSTEGGDVRAAGEQRLERTEWIDRAARVVRIPIERAIDAVVADPKLIGAGASGLVGHGAAIPPGAGGPAPEGAR